METREELLNGLNYVKNMINKIVNAQQEQVRIVAQYRQEEAGIETTGVKAKSKLAVTIAAIALLLYHLVYGILTGQFGTFVLLVIFGAGAWRAWTKNKKGKMVWLLLVLLDGVYPLFYYMKYISFWIIMVLAAAIAFFAVKFVVTKKNQKVETVNMDISRQNSELQAQYDAVTERLAKLKKEMYGNTSSWYPKSYYSLSAVDFFISAVENYRVDSVKEMVNLFESTEDQKRMLQTQQEINNSMRQQVLNQEQIKKELRYANVMNMANLFMQAGTQDAIRANTDAVHATTNAVNRSADRIVDASNRIANSTDKATEALKNIWKKL